MKAIALVLVTTVSCLATLAAAGAAGLQTEGDKTSYSVGYQVGGDFLKQGVELNAEAMVRGVEDAIAGNDPDLDPGEMSRLLARLQKKMVASRLEERERRGLETTIAGKRFLAENAQREGVKTTASGLQYEVIQEGSGDQPVATDTVTVHYRGTLIDGTEFDNSYARGAPARFPLTRVISGWTEGLQLMKPGAKYKFFIPPQLGYGARGAGSIPPHSTLIFEVELIAVGTE